MDISTFLSHRTTVTTSGGDLACTEFGSGPAAVFVHGAATNGALWRHVIEQVSDTTRCVALDLPAHGGTPARDDLSVRALAAAVTELCDALHLDRVDLVANDTGGAVAQVFAASHPERLRTLTLTNCDTDGNFPPPEFAPVVEAAKQGQLADVLVAIAADPAAWRTSPLAASYEDPGRVPDEAWRCYLSPIGGTIDRARHFERLLAAMVPEELAAVAGDLRALDVPTLLVWGTDEAAFDVKWARQLRDTIPGARDVVEVKGAKLFFPEERPGDLVPHLREFWGR